MPRRIVIFLFLTASAAAAFFAGAGRFPEAKPRLVKGIHPAKEVATREMKPLVIVLYAHNDAAFFERCLRSIFQQDYEAYRIVLVDDASVDGTLEKAQQFILENQQEQRIIAIRNEESLGPVGSLVRAAENCFDREVLIPMDVKDWLSQDQALKQINAAFQNPDVWIFSGPTIQYPTYQIGSSEILAFYTGLFRSIPIADLLFKGQFAEQKQTYLSLLTAKAGGRCRLGQEPLFFENSAAPSRAVAGRTLKKSCEPLAQFPSSKGNERDVDCILFSSNQPLQLYALLESMHRYLVGYRTVSVFYETSDAYAPAYEQIWAAFPQLRTFRQGKEFSSLLKKALFESSAEYVVFGGSQSVIKDFVDLNFCRQMLERTHAYAFYLGLGRHIQHSFDANCPEELPRSVPLSHDIYAWDLERGELDWKASHRLDMAIYRKKDLKDFFAKQKYTNVDELARKWASCAPKHAIGLYFEHSKAVDLYLQSRPEELLAQFNEGQKLDIDPFFRIENPSLQCEMLPNFILR